MAVDYLLLEEQVQMSDTLLSYNAAEIEFEQEQEQEQEAEQNAANLVEQQNEIQGPIVAFFFNITIVQLNVSNQNIDQDIDQDQDQVLADVAANALAGVEDSVAIAFGDFDLDALFA